MASFLCTPPPLVSQAVLESAGLSVFADRLAALCMARGADLTVELTHLSALSDNDLLSADTGMKRVHLVKVRVAALSHSHDAVLWLLHHV